jgi:hypothetical protein
LATGKYKNELADAPLGGVAPALAAQNRMVFAQRPSIAARLVRATRSAAVV